MSTYLSVDSPVRDAPLDVTSAFSVATLQSDGDYEPSERLVAALNTALLLGQPLLLTGEPGSGKSEFANWAASRLGYGERLRFDVKSTTTARDMFYNIDNVERFHKAHEQKEGTDLNPLAFIKFRAFGEAIIRANEPDAVHALKEKLFPAHERARRSVVLIDEVDKAPRDVPNDLLREIEDCMFTITEMNRTVCAPPDMRPLVIMTSNAERPLPDPFLRRCVFFHIEEHDADELQRIVDARLGKRGFGPKLTRDAIAVYRHVRDRKPEKKPGVAELLAFILALRAKDFTPQEGLQGQSGWHDDAVSLLLKREADQRNLRSAGFDNINWS